MARPDDLRQRWRAGEATYGGWVVGRDPVLAERMARCGFHEVTIDLQHAPAGEGDVPALTMAIASGGAVPLVRVLALDVAVIGRVLDLGAAGVIVPLVDDEQAAAALVAACRYPPRGTRSTGPVRARYLFGSDEPADLEDVIKIVTIESAHGLDRVEAIAATAGIDVVYVGPADLALGLGLAPAFRRDDREGAVLDAALDRIVRACGAAGVTAGLHCPDGSSAAAAVARGFRMVTVTSDIGLISSAGVAELDRARAREPAPPAPAHVDTAAARSV